MIRFSTLLSCIFFAACGGGGSSAPADSAGATIVSSAGTAVSGSNLTPNAPNVSTTNAVTGGATGNTGDATGGTTSDPTGNTVAPPVKAPLTNSAGAPAYLHILSGGQSLALGSIARPALSTMQPYGNLMLSPGLQGTAGPLQPLVENDSNGITVTSETPSSGMANSLFASDTASRRVVVSVHGQSGVPYEYVKKGGLGPAYANGMTQAAATKAQVEQRGGYYVPLGVTIVHGESDFAALTGSVRYEASLKQWQADYQGDLNALTGGTGTVPMYINQMNTGATGEIAVGQYNAAKNNPGKIYLVGPKYQYEYGPDSLHLTNVQSKHMGEMFAKVIKQVAIDGRHWQPLMPTSVQRSGNLVTIAFAIPVGTLKLDTTTVAQRPNYGFDFVQTGGSRAVSIQSVALTDDDTKVQITLSGTPDGTDQKIRYAWRCYPGGGVGFQECGKASNPLFVGGNLRDSDVSVSPASGSTGLPLHNWLVTFEEPIVLPGTGSSTTAGTGTSGTTAGGSGSGSASGGSTSGGSTATGATGGAAVGGVVVTPPASGGSSVVTPLPAGGTAIAAWGDSLTEGSGGIPFPTQLASLAPGRTIFNGGVAGQNSQQIVARQGSLPVRVSLLGDQIPASGGVDVRTINIAVIDSSFNGPVLGTLAGVYGRLVKSPSGYPAYFIRSQAGAPVAVTANTLFVVDFEGMDQWINVFWIGRNGFQNSAAQVISNIDSAVASLKEPKRFIVMSVLNAGSEPRGSPYYNIIVQLNADLAARYPNNYVDIRSYLIGQYDPTVAQDVRDVGLDLLPSTVQVDGLHLNTRGYGLVARRVAQFIGERGW